MIKVLAFLFWFGKSCEKSCEGLVWLVALSNIFFMFTPNIGEDFQFDDHIFSNGLKPATSEYDDQSCCFEIWKKKFQKLNVWYIYLQHVLQDTLGFQYAIWEDLWQHSLRFSSLRINQNWEHLTYRNPTEWFIKPQKKVWSKYRRRISELNHLWCEIFKTSTYLTFRKFTRRRKIIFYTYNTHLRILCIW